MVKPIFIGLVALASVACVSNGDLEQDILAELGNKKLLVEDIADHLPKSGQMDAVDSISLVNRLVRQWAENELLVEVAEFNLQTELADFEELVAQYRNDLLKHAYIDGYVRQHLDTTITAEQIKDYYEQNLNNFELKESIIQAFYAASPVEAQKTQEAKRWFLSDRYQDKYLDWAEVFVSKQSNYGDSVWIPMMDFLEEIPLESTNPYNYLNRRKKFTCEDTALVYFVQINALRIKDSYSPLPYVEERIEKVLLNKRRLALIEQIEENIIEHAIEEGTLIIH